MFQFSSLINIQGLHSVLTCYISNGPHDTDRTVLKRWRSNWAEDPIGTREVQKRFHMDTRRSIWAWGGPNEHWVVQVNSGKFKWTLGGSIGHRKGSNEPGGPNAHNVTQMNPRRFKWIERIRMNLRRFKWQQRFKWTERRRFKQERSRGEVWTLRSKRREVWTFRSKRKGRFRQREIYKENGRSEKTREGEQQQRPSKHTETNFWIGWSLV